MAVMSLPASLKAHLGGSCNDGAQLLVLLQSQAGAAGAVAQEVFDALAVDLHHRQVHLLSNPYIPQLSCKHPQRLLTQGCLL